MRHALSFIILMILFSQNILAQDRRLETLRAETKKDLLENILPYWEKSTVDPSWGFYGTVSKEGVADKDAPRGTVLYARILWSFSYAYRLYGNKKHKQLAKRAFEALDKYFVDKEYGGLLWMVNADGSFRDGAKQAVTHAYAIYGLAEYYRATKDKRGLKRAIEMYRVLEDKCWDKTSGGYQEMFTKDWQKAKKGGEGNRFPSPKGTGTLFHIMEGYATLYKAWPDEELKGRLTAIVDMLTTKMYDSETHHLLNGYNDDWSVVDKTIFYAHDAEASWLMADACQHITDAEVKARGLRVALELCEAGLSEGLMDNGNMLMMNARGRKSGTGWWCQTEAVLTGVNAYKMTGNIKYLECALKAWDFIKEHYIDKEYGEWFRTCLPDGKPIIAEPKCAQWNCPYHNTRVGFMLEEWK